MLRGCWNRTSWKPVTSTQSLHVIFYLLDLLLDHVSSSCQSFQNCLKREYEPIFIYFFVDWQLKDECKHGSSCYVTAPKSLSHLLSSTMSFLPSWRRLQPFSSPAYNSLSDWGLWKFSLSSFSHFISLLCLKLLYFRHLLSSWLYFLFPLVCHN